PYCFSIAILPPCASLFPYTTLFRSNRSMDILERFTGKRPVGWLGPGLTQTLETPELLVSAGVKYIGDWVYDDEPTVIRTAKGPLDRKSTRLNSSHVAISYAALCLKK